MVPAKTGVVAQAAATANRLRLLQTDLADHDPRARQEALTEEIQQALTALVPAERPAFLSELEKRFPSWDGNVAVTAPQQTTASQSALDLVELNDWTFLVKRLTAIAEKLPGSERQAVIDRLAEAGLAPLASDGGLPRPALRALMEKLKAKDPDAPVDAARLADFAAILADFADSSEQIVAATCALVGAQVRIPPRGFRNNSARFLAGDQDVPRGQVTQDVERIRKLAALILLSVGPLGLKLEEWFGRQFAPEEILSRARAETGTLGNVYKTAWQRFTELAQQLDRDAVQGVVKDSIRKNIEQAPHLG